MYNNVISLPLYCIYILWLVTHNLINVQPPCNAPRIIARKNIAFVTKNKNCSSIFECFIICWYLNPAIFWGDRNTAIHLWNKAIMLTLNLIHSNIHVYRYRTGSLSPPSPPLHYHCWSSAFFASDRLHTPCHPHPQVWILLDICSSGLILLLILCIISKLQFN